MNLLLPFLHYFEIATKKEKTINVIVPTIIAASLTLSTINSDSFQTMLNQLYNVIPILASILIGFTATMITIVITDSSRSFSRLKGHITTRKINGDNISIYRLYFIQLYFVLYCEIILIFIVILFSLLTSAYTDELVSSTIASGIMAFTVILLLFTVLISLFSLMANMYSIVASHKEID
jgi:hypothetical protein